MSNTDNGNDQVTLTLDRSTAAELMQGLATRATGTGATPSVSAWQTLPNAPVASSRTDDIWFHDENTGWLVNSNGDVWRTNDGGNSWTKQLNVPSTLPSKPYLRTIHFAPQDGKTGWFGALCGKTDGYLGTLLHGTTDGGKSWKPISNLPAGAPQGICGISVVNSQVMYGAGSNDPARLGPAVIKTIDGGKSWSLIDMKPYANNLIDVWFWNEQQGYVVGGRNNSFCPGNQPWYTSHPQYAKLRPVVLYTEDGGKTWTNQVAALNTAFDCGSWGWKMYWLDQQRGFVSIEDFHNGAILRTTNGGKSWVMLRINDQRSVGKSGKGKGSKGKSKGSKATVSNANLEGIGFIDENQGWVGGWGDANFIGNYNSATVDGGFNWVAQDHNPNDSKSDPRVNVNRYRFIGKSGYCSGKTVYKMNLGGGKSDKSAPKSATLLGAAPAPALSLSIRPGDAAGELSISFDVPAGAKQLTLDAWSHFGWHVATVLSEKSPQAGSRTIEWDGKAHIGDRLIFRLSADSESASQTVLIS
jgi:photosystem II stability/assembly factor-like uncharacterized protein